MFDLPARSARRQEKPGQRPEPSPPTMSFRDYVLSRKYDYGRGRAASWAFIAFARGDATFPEIESLPELRRYVAATRPDLLGGARSVWRSFVAHRSLMRRRAER